MAAAASSPLVTAEVRWFADGPVPAEVEAWFASLGPPVGTEARHDLYLPPTDDALGVKLRAGRLELKRRAAVGEMLRAGAAEAPVETWAKWPFGLTGSPDPGGWRAVEKQRRQRRHAEGDSVCALELTAVVLSGREAWTVGLEATGPTGAARLRALHSAADRWARTVPEPLAQAVAQGYPAWLRVQVSAG